MKSLALFFIALSCIAGRVSAQEFIGLTDSDSERLDLAFLPVEYANQQSGISLPAIVIPSPESIAIATARFEGVLERWHFEPGSQVQEGELLASIRSPKVLELQSEWLRAVSQMEQARLMLDREQRLFDEGIIAEQRLIKSRGEHRLSELNLQTVESQLQQAGMMPENLQQLLSAGSELGIYLVRSPISGLLTHRAHNVGDFLESSAAVASLQGSVQPWLSIMVPARLASGLQPGSKLSIADSGEMAILRRRDFEIDQNTQTLEVQAEFEQSASYLPGRVLNVLLQPEANSIALPSSAVVHSGDETVVYVRAPGGVEARILDLTASGTGYLASSGIQVGEQVLVRGAAAVKGIQLGLGSEQ